ncbi:hypothetical protein KKI19_03880 [Patescibacteria group bacterium]|nr:hypothetical protein [Patescibacteria group bacterium]
MSEFLKPEIIFPKENKETPPGVLRIGVDLDANVDEIDTWVCRLVKRGLGVDIKKKLEDEGSTNFWLHQWEEIRNIPHGPDFVKEIFKRTFVYECARPIPNAIETLNKWKEQEHQIWFITARTKDALYQVTLEWLEKNNLGWAKNRLLMPQSLEKDRVRFKNSEAQRLDLHFFIEDHAETVKAVTPSSLIRNLVLEYSWNVTEDIGSQSAYVENWQEIDRIVQEASRWHYFLHSTKP